MKFHYDAQGNVVLHEYPKLDSAGNLVANQYNQVVSEYDVYGNRTRLDDPNQGAWTYQYNAFGELIQQTDARGESTAFTYDALGRMITQRDSETYAVWTYDLEEPGLLDTVTQYDISALSASAKAALTPANVTSTAGATLSYQQDTDYDDFSKLPNWMRTRQRDRVGQLLETVSTTDYDGYGRVQYTQLPAYYQNAGTLTAPRLSYRYNGQGYLDRIADRDSDTVYQLVERMDAFGNVALQTLGGTVELRRGYDAHTGWATDLLATNGTGQLIEQVYSGYNALGHIGRRDDTTWYNGGADEQSWVDTYQYRDSLGQQLTDVDIQYNQRVGGVTTSEAWSQGYGYDALGNLRSKTVARGGLSTTQSYQYADAARPHRLTTVTGSLTRSYQYDANGNAIHDGEKSLTYNAWNKIRQLTKGGDSTRFDYGPDRRRTLRVDQHNGATTETLYLGEGYERVTTIDGSTTVEHKYYVNGVAIITQTEGSQSEVTRYLVSDYQQSVLAITDGSGQLIQRYRYDAYGDQQEVSSLILTSLHLTTRGYTGHEHIEGMDIIHMNGRIYDPLVGRMVQVDPVVQAPEFVVSYNRYSYTWNNPINLVDPKGYEVDDDGNTFDHFASDYGWRSGEAQASGVGSARDGSFRGANSQLGSPDPRKDTTKDAQKRVLNNSGDAVDHYFNGNGDPAALSDAVKQKIMNHPNVQDQVNRNINGTGKPPNRIDINFESDGWDTFHLGYTKVIYTETCAGGSCTTTFTAPIYDASGVPDRFQDPLYLGFELPGGVPYEYETFDWSVTYPKP